jgi:hypothetical protein
MYRARFYPILQRPLRILLWEIEDLAFTIFVTGVLALGCSAFDGAIGAIVTLTLLPIIKRGKPPGWILYITYRLGLFSLLPKCARPRGLTPAPLPGQPRILCLSPSWRPSDDRHRISRHIWPRI